ncbi:hypothetical protein Hanom_Chr17g01565661 [Helianthus anomalus]
MKVSATTGFIMGQLIMFISIYYALVHLALVRPHTITILALPYLLYHFFCSSKKNFLDYGSTTTNSMRNLSIQCVGLLLVWIRQNRSIRKYIQANKYLVSELKYSMSMAGMFSI